MAAAGPALSLTLCPAVEEHEHIDVNEHSPVSAVGTLAQGIYVSAPSSIGSIATFPNVKR